MTATSSILKITSNPGIKRDGTLLEGNSYVDGLWCRWFQGLPRKMGGYTELKRDLGGLVRAIHQQSRVNLSTIHLGSQSVLQRAQVDIPTGTITGLTDRTPAGFATSAYNNWQMDALFSTATTTATLIAHAAPNILDISDDTNTPLYYGDLYATAALTAIAGSSVSGGTVVLHPYTFRYGNDGYIAWSMPGVPTDITSIGTGEARVDMSKVVRGMRLRGGGASPAGIFWGLDSVIRSSFVGSTNGYFAFDPLLTQSSLLSSNGIIEYFGVYYWATSGAFLQYNGAISEVQNNQNLDWFLSNLNFAQRQKVFAFKVPRWGEIWWCFPFGNATECTHAVIYNVRGNFWYDTQLPNGGRTAGAREAIYTFPLMTGMQDNGAGKYSLWRHEDGVNETSGTTPTAMAVRSYFETNEISMAIKQDGSPGIEKSTHTDLFEPDFTQTGDLSLTITGRKNARAPERTSGPHRIVAPSVPGTLGPSVAVPADELVKLKDTVRLMRFKIESNTVNGNYVTGIPVIHVDPADGRHQS